MKVLYVLNNHFVLSESYIETEMAWMKARGVSCTSYSYKDGGTLAGAVKAFRPDLIHVHWLNLAEVFATDLEREKIPVTIRAHSFDATEQSIEICSRIKTVKKLWVFPKYMRADYRPPIHPMPACYDETLYRPAPFYDQRQVVRAGAGLPGKGWEEMLAIARLVPDIKFVLIMTRPTWDPSWPEKNIRPNLPSNVELKLDVPHEEAAQITRSSGFYIRGAGSAHPWAMPVSCLEALASGCVTLAPPAGRDCFGDAVLTYTHPGSAARQLYETLDWPGDRWIAQREAAIRAAQPYRTSVVLPSILAAWRTIVGIR